MATKVPELSAPNANAAVKTAPTGPSEGLQHVANALGVAREVNKQVRVAKSAEAFSDIQQEFIDATLGKTEFELAPLSQELLGKFSSTQKKLQSAVRTGQLTPDQANTRAEVELRKLVARAPGLQEEFIKVARSYGLSPVNAGFEEAKKYLSDFQANAGAVSSKAIESLAEQLEKSGDARAAFELRTGAITPEMAMGNSTIKNMEAAIRGSNTLKNKEQGIKISEADEYVAVRDISAAAGQRFEYDVVQQLPVELRSEYIRFRQGGSTMSNTLAQEVAKAMAVADADFRSEIASSGLSGTDLEKATASYEQYRQVFSDIVQGKATAEGLQAVIDNTSLLVLQKGITDPGVLRNVAAVASLKSLGIPEEAVSAMVASTGYNLLNLLGGKGSLDGVRSADADAPEAQISGEELFLRVAEEMGRQPEIKPEQEQSALQWTQEIMKSIDKAKSVDDVVRYAELLNTSAFVQLKDKHKGNVPLDEYKKKVATVGGDLMYAAVSPMRDAIMNREIALTSENGVLGVTDLTGGVGRGRNVSAQVARAKNLVQKFNRISEAWSSVTQLDKQELVTASIEDMLLNDTDLRAQLEDMDLAGTGGQTGKSVNKQRDRLQDQINALQEQLKALGEE